MARILVAGGLWEEDENQQLRKAREIFAAALGREVIAQGHVLLGGCRTALDAQVASAARAEAEQRNLDARRVIRSWVSKTTTPSHSIGNEIFNQRG
jgi:hypothetical protein